MLRAAIEGGIQLARKPVETVFSNVVVRSQPTGVELQPKLFKGYFGFVPGRATTDAIFIVSQLYGTHIATNKPLYFPFVDLEKAASYKLL